MLLIEAKLMHTLTDLVNENLKRNLLRNVVLTESEVKFLFVELNKIGTIGQNDTTLLKNILKKLEVSNDK